MNKELPAGSSLSHYRIVSKIGEGGMGEVYLAQDMKLDRKVALKILPADVASNYDRMERFVREAKSAATLNHPNIAHIYEIGDSDGTHYIAMEFIDGETLREKIHREKTPLSKLLKYLIQVAQGLSKAHAAGIVHRDLKPDNIMITRDDYAKVLDFGLAKLVEPQRTFGSESGSSEIATAVMQKPGWDSGRSTPGMVLGTIGYMSPEQASGRVDEIDLRSDIFSFGCILFEAATGQRAFEGKDVLDSLHKIVHAPTPQLKDANPLAPAELQRVVRRCLAKEREKRYQSIKELVIELDDLQQELKGFTESEYSGRPTQATSPATSGMTRGDEGFWVAVLPFKSSGTAAELKALAEGLSEDIVTGLSRFSYLRVIARGSTIRYANQTTDVRTVGKELDARYVMEGTLRQAGKKLRLAVQLVDATTGAHLWAENYEREFSPETIFELQDDLVPRIVSTVADWYGVLPHSMSESVRLRPPDQLSPYEALLRSFGYFENIAPQEHAVVRSSLERAVGQEPGNADCWAMLSMLIGEEHRFGFNVKPDSLGRSLTAARKAVEIAHANHFAWLALAQALFFRKEFDPFRDAAERSIALNPMDGSTVEYLGHLIAFSGDWERGCELAERARQLNPNHPSWYWSVSFLDAYRKGDYLGARPFLLKGNPQKNWLMHAVLAAVQGQLGETEAAATHLREVLTMMPDFPSTARGEFSKWYLPELVEQLMDGLHKAGLESGDEELAPPTSSAPSFVSSETRADDGFWVAVLPFKFTGSNTEVATLADGLSEEIVTGLSRFSYLRVISRSSTLRYANEAADVRAIGKSLGARYVMEGSLRQAGTKVRLAVQLVDTTSGAHLWAQTYDRVFDPEAGFELQDDLVPRIVSTCGDRFGVLARNISDAVRGTEPAQLGPYEALMRAFGYHQRLTPVGHADARDALERAVDRAPSNADCWAMLSWIYSHEHAHGFNVRSGSLDRALAAARRAVDIAPSNQLAQQALAVVLFFRKETAGCLSAAERAISLNPLDTSNEAIFLIAFNGDWDRGCALIRRAMDLNPHHPRWYELTLAINEYRLADYRGAIDAVMKANAPEVFWGNLVLAAAYGQLGELRAGQALRDLLVQKPDFGQTAPELLAKWMDPQLVEHLIEGLRKAGLEIAGEEPFVHHVAIESSREQTAVTSSTVDLSFGGRPAIAVLPFQNLSGDPEQEYFADGITEEILNALAQIPGLRVAGRSSSFSFKGRNEDLRTVGTKLGVGTILEGTLRRSGDRLRITAQLIDAGSGYQLWSERYDRVIEDVFTVQDEIANTIAERLQLSLNAESEAQQPQPATRHIGAYELYLKGRALLYQRGLSIPKAIDCFTQAVSLDPSYAQAWAGLADGYTTFGYSGFKPAIEVMPLALDAARRALELDENLAEAHNALACPTLLYERDYNLARLEFERALELNPNYPQARAWYGLFYLQWVDGNDLESRAELLRLLQIDPLSGYANVIFSFFCASSERPAEAVEHARLGVQLDPSSYLAQWSLAVALECDGQSEEAVAATERALAMSGRHTWALTTLASIYGAWSRPDDARAVYRELEVRRAREYIQPSMMAIAAAAVDEMDRAIELAQEALDDRDPLFVMIARAWPQNKKLRADSRFLEIVRELGFPNWNSEVAL
jgi:TolB-like protein/Tfp pilus assembly protein PilF